MAQEPTLTEEDVTKLDGIVSRMVANGESDEDIQFVVDDFKAQHIGSKKKEETDPSTISLSDSELSVEDSATTSPEEQFGEKPIEDKPPLEIVNEAGEDILPTGDEIPEGITPENKELIEKIKTEKDPKKKTSYGKKLWDSLATGSAELGATVAAIPETIYDIFSIPQNLFAAITGYDTVASSEKFKKDFDVTNPILDLYVEESERLGAIVEKQNAEFEQSSSWESFKNGNVSDGFAQLGTGITRSAPISISMMLGGASVGVGKLAAASTVAFVGEERRQMGVDNPNMSELEKTVKSIGIAGAESVFGAISAGTMGKVYKDIISKQGVEKGAVVFKEGLIKMYETALKKYGAPIGALGEGIEEVATTMTQNMINGKPVFEGVGDSFIQGVAGGALYGAPINAVTVTGKIKDAHATSKTNKVVAPSDFNSLSEVFAESTTNTEQIEISKVKNASRAIEKEVSEAVENGDMTKEFGQKVIDEFNKTKKATELAGKIDLTPKQEEKAVGLLKRKDELLQQIDGGDKALAKKEVDELASINEQLGNIREDAPVEATEDAKPVVEEVTKPTPEVTPEVTPPAPEVKPPKEKKGKKKTKEVTEPVTEELTKEPIKENKLEGKKFTSKTNEEFTVAIFDGANGEIDSVDKRKNKDRAAFLMRDKDGKTVGRANFWQREDGKWYSNITKVDKAHQGKGIATAMYEYAENNGMELVPSTEQTDAGKKLWESKFKKDTAKETVKKGSEKGKKEVKETDLDKVLAKLTPEQKAGKLIIVNKKDNEVGGKITYHDKGKFYQGKSKEVVGTVKEGTSVAPTADEKSAAVAKLEKENKGIAFNVRHTSEFGVHSVTADFVVKPKLVSKANVQKAIDAKVKTAPKKKAPKKKSTSKTTEQQSQARDENLTKERIRAAKRPAIAVTKKLPEIIGDIAKKLQATLRFGRSGGRRTIGTFFSRSALVKVKQAGDLDTAAHELGHFLDDKFGYYNSINAAENVDDLNKELKWFADRGGSNPPSRASAKVKRDYIQREGLAEFIRAYIVNPAQAKVIAPNFYKHFENTADKQTIDALKEFSEDYLTFANAVSGDKIASNVESLKLPDKAGFRGWLDSFRGEDGVLSITPWDTVKSYFTNSMTVANKAFFFGQNLKGNLNLNPEENFELMTRIFAGVNGKINNFLSRGLRDGKNKLRKDSQGKTMTIDYLIEGLDNTSEKTMTQEMNEVIQLLVAQRTVEYVGKLERTDNLTGIGGGVQSDISVAVEHLENHKQLKKDNPEKAARLEDGARRYREFADAGLQYAVDKGRLSPKKYREIKATNEYYVSLARERQSVPDQDLDPFQNVSGKLASVKPIIRRAKGGTDLIKNPYMSLLENTVNIIKESDRNEVMNTFVDNLTVQRGMGQGEQKDLAQIGAQVPSGTTGNVLKVYRKNDKGKIVEQTWQFDKDVYNALKGLQGSSNNMFQKVLKAPADLIRWSITHFPVFAARNIVRDTFSRLVISRTVGRGFGQAKVEGAKDLYEVFGGSQAGFYLTSKTAYASAMIDASRKLTNKGGVILDPRKMSLRKGYQNYQKLLQGGENVNRLLEYKSAYKKAKKQGMDDYNAGLYAAYQSRDLMDFAVAGSVIREVNKYVPFTNAAVQSVKRSIKGVKESPVLFSAKMGLYTVMPSMIMHSLAVLGDYEDDYEELPDYQRDLYWNFKLPIGGDVWYSIPKPFELGIPSAIIDRLVSKARGHEDAMDGATISALKAIMPFDEASLLGSFRPLVEASINKDIFRDKDIIPYWEKDKDLNLREQAQYASRLGKGASSVVGLFGGVLDPRKVDHVVKGYLTYYGDLALTLSDLGREDSRYSFRLSKTGFAKDPPVGTSKSVKKAFDLAQRGGLSRDAKVQGLQGRIQVYYLLTDPKEKRMMIEHIRGYAKGITPYLEHKLGLKHAKVEFDKEAANQ